MGYPFDPKLSKEELYIAFPNLNSIEIIKSGGEGTVFKAINNNQKTVAVKVYSSDHLQSRNKLEVKKLLKINNPYISKLYSYGSIVIRNENCFFTETDYIIGNDLRRLLNNNYTFTVSDVTNMIKCISSCIQALWQEHVVHCDIKPDNIIKNNDSYFLIDLGIAKHLDATTMTAFGVIMGTLGYLAPEQFKGRKNLTFKADYYALGVTAYELLVGSHPFNRDQQQMLLPSAKIQFPDHIEIPSNIKHLICKLSEPLPFNRPMNYAEILRHIEK